jgi:hypothetical protein
MLLAALAVLIRFGLSDDELLTCVKEAGEGVKSGAKCCKDHEDAYYCKTIAEMCENVYDGKEVTGTNKEEAKKGCDNICKEVRFKWCKGLSTGAIVGIAIAAVVVVGVAIGLIVFFVLRKKKGVEAGKEDPDQRE